MEGEVSGLPKGRQPMVLWLQDVRSPGAEEAQEQHRWVDTLVQSLPGFDKEELELSNIYHIVPRKEYITACVEAENNCSCLQHERDVREESYQMHSFLGSGGDLQAVSRQLQQL